MDIQFDGQADYTLDAKNRLTVPARYRGSLAGGLVLAKGIDPCVQIWTPAAWDDFRQASLQGVHPMSASGRKIKLFFSANSLPGTLDGAGRIALPPFLLDHANLHGREVTVAGAGDHLQIWERAAWTDYNKRLTEDMLTISEGFDDLPADAR
jgi:MraZ protein